MLKIKDNVDLKELEKFGFKEDIIVDEKCYIKEFNLGINYRETIIIWEKDKNIQVNANNILDTLYDLIQANLVEKVEE